MATIDVGSTNIDVYDRPQKKFLTTDRTYVNTVETCILVKRMHAARVKPHLTCWAIPFLRAAEALLDTGAMREPAYVQFVFCEGGTIGGHPCTTGGALTAANQKDRMDGDMQGGQSLARRGGGYGARRACVARRRRLHLSRARLPEQRQTREILCQARASLWTRGRFAGCNPINC
jgi:hypothetical protein